MVLTDGEGFSDHVSVEALKVAVWGGRELPQDLSEKLTAVALNLPAGVKLNQAWKETLRDYRSALPSKPPKPPGFWDKLRGVRAAEANPVNRAFLDELMEALKRHKEITESNRDSYRGDGSDEAMRKIYWPSPVHPKRPRNLFDETPFARATPLVTKQTAIVSAGSCFAMEIAHWLQDHGYNYVVTDRTGTNGRLPNASARWGTLFNAPSFRQLMEHAFGIRSLPKLLWKMQRYDGSTVLADPFREDVGFESVEQWEADYEPHRANARKALESAEIFIMTLGMAEVWRTRHTEFYCSRCHWGLASELVERKIMTVEETVAELEKMLTILRAHNPKVKIIISASPVPLHATFRSDDMSVITANAYSKAVQRISAEQFARRNDNVFYFPSYESVMHCTRNAWDDDQRHVSREAVGKVMKLFCQMFVDPQDLPPSEQEPRSTGAHDLLNPGS